MAKKKKIIFDKKKSDLHRSIRIPTPKKGGPMDTDKKKYNRKQKHKKAFDE